MEETPLDSNSADTEQKSYLECNQLVPPDGGWGWIIVVATFLTSLVVDGILFSFGILLPEILEEFHEGKSLTSWVGSALTGTYLFIGPVAGVLANKYGCRTVSIAGSFISAAGFGCSMFANSIIYLIISYGIIGGIGFGFIYLPSMVIIQTYFDKKRAFATGIAVCGSGIGMFIISPLTHVLIELYGWRGMLLIQAGISLHCAPISGLFRPVENSMPRKKFKPMLLTTKLTRDSAANSEEMKLSIIEEESVSNENYLNAKINRTSKLPSQSISIDKQKKWKLSRLFKKKPKKAIIRRVTSFDFNKSSFNSNLFLSGSLATIPRYVAESVDAVSKADETHIGSKIKKMLNLNLLKSPTFVTICVAGFLTFMGFFVPFIYLSDYAISTNRTKAQASYLISVIGITNTVGRLICGWITDRPHVKALHINNSALLVSGTATALVPYCVTYEIQMVYCVVFGLAIACYVSLRSILLVEYLGLDTLTNSIGLCLLFQGTASMIGPPVAGWFYKQGNSYNVPFYVAGSIMAVSGLICVPLPWISAWEVKGKKKKLMKINNQPQTQNEDMD